MSMDEMRERLTAIDAELSNIVAQIEEPDEGEERAETEELEARSAELMEERATIVADIEKAEAAIAEEKRAMEEVIAKTEVIELEKREDNKMTDMEIRNSNEYINAYAEYIKSGDDAECRALLTENASGTIAVPEMVYDIVKTAWERDGITARVRKAYIQGNLKVGFELSAGDATVHTEGQQVSEESLVLGTVELVPKSIKKWVSISDEALDLRGEAFLRYIYDELTYKIAKKAADELIAQIKACGTVSTTTQVAVPVIASTTVGNGVIAQAMAQLSDDAANPVVMMNKATWGQFMAAKYAAGFDADPFEGLPVLFNNTITSFTAATTGVPYAIVGDLEQGALFNFPNGEEITFKVDELSQADYDLVRIIGREFVGIGVVAPNAFVKITK
jgi:HK97 family phage major capsid protein